MAKKKDAKSKGELMEQDQDALEVHSFDNFFKKYSILSIIWMLIMQTANLIGLFNYWIEQ